MTVDASKRLTERAIGIGALVVALLAPMLFSSFYVNSILTQALILGIGAASLIYLSAYGGMISLAQTGLMGIAGYALANMVTQRVPGGETKGLLLGWNPTVALIAALLLTVGIGLVFGAVASRSYGIYFLMLTLTYTVIAFLFVGSVTLIGGFSPVAGVDIYTPSFIGDIAQRSPAPLLHRTDLGGLRLHPHPIPHTDAVRDIASGDPGRTPAHGVPRLQRRAPSNDRLRHRRLRRGNRRSALRVVVRAAIADHDGARRDDPAAHHRRYRRACAGSRARGSARSRSS